MKRRVYEVRYDATGGRWVIHRRSSPAILATAHTKELAIAAGARMAKRLSRVWPSQLVVHNQDGTYSFERTYPDRTPRRRG